MARGHLDDRRRCAPRTIVAARPGSPGRRCRRRTSTASRARRPCASTPPDGRERHRPQSCRGRRGDFRAAVVEEELDRAGGFDGDHVAVEDHGRGRASPASPADQLVRADALAVVERERGQVHEMCDVRVGARVGDHRAAVGMTDQHDGAADRRRGPGGGCRRRRARSDPGAVTDGLSTAAVATPAVVEVSARTSPSTSSPCQAPCTSMIVAARSLTGRDHVALAGATQPTHERTPRAISRSSRAVTTKVRTAAPGAVISPSAVASGVRGEVELEAARGCAPSGACSPTPPVNTNASTRLERRPASPRSRGAAGACRRRTPSTASASPRGAPVDDLAHVGRAGESGEAAVAVRGPSCTSAALRPAGRISQSTSPGSTEPARVAMTRPSSGVKPIVVSTDDRRAPRTATRPRRGGT